MNTLSQNCLRDPDYDADSARNIPDWFGQSFAKTVELASAAFASMSDSGKHWHPGKLSQSNCKASARRLVVGGGSFKGANIQERVGTCFKQNPQWQESWIWTFPNQTPT